MKWIQHLWIVTCVYFALGLFNILFAWLGLIFFFAPLIIAVFRHSKGYCTICDRGRLFNLLGHKLKLSRNRPMPAWLKSLRFRYAFLLFFWAVFIAILAKTVLVFASLKNPASAVTLFWTWDVPWHWAVPETDVPGWAVQFAFGFYSLMLTSTLIGLICMLLFKPRAWCVFCPMGSMTQLVCKWQAKRHPGTDSAPER